MKNQFFFFLLFFSKLLFAQAPEKINYQAIIRNSAGNVVANSMVALRVQIRQSNATGSIAYQERHNPVTSAQGLINLAIGVGTAETGSFSTIAWNTGPYFIQLWVNFNPGILNGGTWYDFGTQQLLSVPYALFAKSAENQLAVKTTTEPVGLNCSTGGVKLEYGFDSNFNDLLDASEINPSLTQFICNGQNGIQGIQGVAGPIGLTGPQGPIGLTGLTGATGPQGTPGSLNAWSLTGNAGTNPTTNFIGTTDAQDWAVKTNNFERIRVNASGLLGIGTTLPLAQLTISEKNLPNIPTFAISDDLNFKRFSINIEGNSDSSFSNVRFDVFPKTNSDQAQFRFFNQTNTSGSKTVRFYRGNGTAVPSAVIGVDGENSFFQRHGGNFGIGTNFPIQKLHVNNDVSGEDSSFVVDGKGYVGIGTNNPLDKLHILDGGVFVENSNNFYSSVLSSDGALELYRSSIAPIGPEANGYIDFKDNINDDYDFRIYYSTSALLPPNGGLVFKSTTNGLTNTGATRLVIKNNNGYVGIGTWAPDQLLSVNGNASKAGGGSWATFSDKRVKKDIQPFNDGLNVLMKLNPVTFKYNEKSGYTDVNKSFVGFIAQDIEMVAPYMVNLYDDSNGPSGLSDKRQFDESALNKILVNAVKEQQSQIEQLKKDLEEMKLIIKELKKD